MLKNFGLGVLLGLAMWALGALDVRAEDYGYDYSYIDYSYDLDSSDWSYDEEVYPPDDL